MKHCASRRRSKRVSGRLIYYLIVLSAVRAMGGQAVLNGVMMRGEDSYAVAVRRMDESIDIKRFDVPSFAQKFVKIPFLRGVMGLGEAMSLGYRALMHSADLMMIDEEAKLEAEQAASKSSSPSNASEVTATPSSVRTLSSPLVVSEPAAPANARSEDIVRSVSDSDNSSDGAVERSFGASDETIGSSRPEGCETDREAVSSGGEEEREEKEGEKVLSNAAVGTSVAFSLVFFVALFIMTPVLAGKWIEHSLHLSHWQGFIVESSLRLVIFLGYLSLVSLMPEIKRVFQYHGAEHKAIAAYENDVVLTPQSAQQFTTAHVRCGTNFLLIVMVISIVFYAAIAAFLPGIPLWGLLLSRILVIPLIAGVSYEIIRGAATRMSNIWVRSIIRPGLLLQKVTTRIPSDEQCEVAIASLNEVFTLEQKQEVVGRTRLKANPSWQTL